MVGKKTHRAPGMYFEVARKLSLTLLILYLWHSEAPAQSTVEAREYEQCVDFAMSKPEVGFERAIAWRDLGGGFAARHCVAVALFALSQFREAALRLERLAKENISLDLRISLLDQAGTVWLMGEEYERANATLTTGLELAPLNFDLLVDRSLVYAAAKNYWEALDDLNRALDIDPENAEALVFRANVYRYLDSLELAEDDVNRALELRSDHVAAYLERGNIRRLNSNKDDAREDWLEVIRLAPNSLAAEAARHNLEKLDINSK